MPKNKPFFDTSSLVFSFWRCGCSVSLAMGTPLTQEGSRPPPCPSREFPPALRKVSLPLSPQQAGTPLTDPGTIYHACSMDTYGFFIAKRLSGDQLLSHVKRVAKGSLKKMKWSSSYSFHLAALS